MKKGAATLASITYARDGAGQLKSATQTGLPGAETPEYKYDERERLKEGAGTSFKYDPANNPIELGTTKLEYDKASELEKAGTTKYAFDKLGERTEAKPETGPVTKYGYDQAGNLVSVNRAEEGKIKKIEDSYAYDGNDLRASQTINGTTTHMAWDTAEPLPLLLSDGTNYYIYGPDGLPFEQVAGETVTYLHHDQLGSTRLLTNSSGEATGKYTYTPYGAVEEHTGTASTPLGYDGQYTSEDTGLIYLRARVYDPSTAQFLSVDPLAAGTGETYNYAGDSPVNGGNPAGMWRSAPMSLCWRRRPLMRPPSIPPCRLPQPPLPTLQPQRPSSAPQPPLPTLQPQRPRTEPSLPMPPEVPQRPSSAPQPPLPTLQPQRPRTEPLQLPPEEPRPPEPERRPPRPPRPPWPPWRESPLERWLNRPMIA